MLSCLDWNNTLLSPHLIYDYESKDCANMVTSRTKQILAHYVADKETLAQLNHAVVSHSME